MSEQTKGAELLPCPFCGGSDIEYDEDTDMEACAVLCGDCGGEGGAGYNRAEAIAAWNRRAEPVADPGDTRRLDWLEAKQAALLPVEGNIMPAGTWAVEQAADDVDMGPGPRGAIDEAMRVEAHRALNEEGSKP